MGVILSGAAVQTERRIRQARVCRLAPRWWQSPSSGLSSSPSPISDSSPSISSWRIRSTSSATRLNTSRCFFLPLRPWSCSLRSWCVNRWPAVWKDLGYLVGWLAVLVGLTGVILHLESHFFYERTLRSLTYSAPFAAPLAYTGLGFLLIMNRMVDPEIRGVGAMGAPAHTRRLYRQLCLQPRGPRRKRLLQSPGMGAGVCQCHRGGVSRGSSSDAHFESIHRSMRGDSCPGIRHRSLGICAARDGKSARPFRSCL